MSLSLVVLIVVSLDQRRDGYTDTAGCTDGWSGLVRWSGKSQGLVTLQANPAVVFIPPLGLPSLYSSG
jgi:hypothetical protein